jgi:hypothetical protein
VVTAALALLNCDGNLLARVAAKRDRLLQHLRGQSTSDDSASSRPFVREGQRIERAILEEEYAFWMEQVLSVQVSRLTSDYWSFSTVLRPIF